MGKAKHHRQRHRHHHVGLGGIFFFFFLSLFLYSLGIAKMGSGGVRAIAQVPGWREKGGA